MLKYLYIPETEDLDDHIDFAVQNNFNQIIHGKSDIINDLVQDKDSVQEINIPEIMCLYDDFLVFKENEEFSIKFVNEFSVDKKDSKIKFYLYKLNEKNPKEKIFMFSEDMKRLNSIHYEIELILNEYGEYKFYISEEHDSENKNILLSDSIIIYKEYQEGLEDEKFFFA